MCALSGCYCCQSLSVVVDLKSCGSTSTGTHTVGFSFGAMSRDAAFFWQAETVERSVSLNKLRKDLNKLSDPQRALSEHGSLSSTSPLGKSPGVTRLPPSEFNPGKHSG